MSSIYQMQIPLQENKKYIFQKVLVVLDGQMVELWLLVPWIYEETGDTRLN